MRKRLSLAELNLLLTYRYLSNFYSGTPGRTLRQAQNKFEPAAYGFEDQDSEDLKML